MMCSYTTQRSITLHGACVRDIINRPLIHAVKLRPLLSIFHSHCTCMHMHHGGYRLVHYSSDAGVALRQTAL